MRKIRSERLKNARRRASIQWTLVTLALAGSLTLFVGTLSRSPQLLIKRVDVTGNKVLSENDVRDVVDQALKGRYGGILIERRNSLVYPKDTIRSAIRLSFPRVLDISIKRSGLTALVVGLVERKPFALWCGQSDSETCYFLDENGYIFSSAPRFSGDVYIRFTGGVGATSPVGAFVLGAERFSEFRRFLEGVDSLGDDTRSVSIEDDGHFKLALSDGIVLLVSGRMDLSESLENLTAVVRSAEFSADVAKVGKSLSYIDLRFGNRIYYRFEE